MACQALGTLESHGDPSLGLLSTKDNGFYVHREMTLTLRLAQSKQTDIVKIKIPPAPRLMTRNSCNRRLASLLENTSRSRRARGNLPMTGRLGKPSRTYALNKQDHTRADTLTTAARGEGNNSFRASA